MVKLNLKADTAELEVLKSYLEENASPTLVEKIENGVKITKDGKIFRFNYFYAELSLKFHNLLEIKLLVAKKQSLFYNKSVCQKEKIVLNLFYILFC